MVAAALPREEASFSGRFHLHALHVTRQGETYAPDSIIGGDSLRAWLREELRHLDRPLAADEREVIATLRDIWQSRRVQRTWSDLHFPVAVTIARQILDDCTGDAVIGLGLEGEGGSLQLFDRSIGLGRERLLFFQVCLANQRAVRAFLGTQPRDDAAIDLYFVPGANESVEADYFDPPRLLDPLSTETSALTNDKTSAMDQEDTPGDYRPGRWRILTTPPLLAPVEIAPTPEKVFSGWRLEVPDRVNAKLNQLELDERAAVLDFLWSLQRRGGRKFLDQHTVRAGDGSATIYLLSPTPDLRIILRPISESTLLVAEIVYTETLRLFRER